MSLLELPMILLYVRMTSAFPAHNLVTGRGNLVFLYLKYIKVKYLGPYFNMWSLWDFSTIKFLVRDYKLIFPIFLFFPQTFFLFSISIPHVFSLSKF